MKGFLKTAAIVFFAIIIVIASALFFFLNAINEDNINGPEGEGEFLIPDPPEKDERVNVLVMGVDLGNPLDGRAPSRADTMILASFEPKEKKLDLVSLPRDTRVNIKGKGLDKLGHAHAYGGAPLAMETVGDFLDIDIHYYFSIDYAGFRKFVDNLGGVRVNVPFDMDYYDPYDNPPLRINLKKGWQTLNGEKALQYVRNREGYPNGDIGRIEAQQAFIDAAIDQIISAGTILRLPALAETLSSHMKTNMTATDMGKYAFRAAGIEKELINMYRIPGDAEYIEDISYFLYDKQKTQELISTIFDKNESIRVEVLNGSGVSGLASKVGDMLEDKGYEVVRIGNADHDGYSSTLIYDRKGHRDYAKEIAEILDVNEYKVERKDDAIADVTVILGEDSSNL